MSTALANIKLTVTSHVVLGLIALRGPSTPYDLKRAVGRSVAFFWPFPHSQLYSEPDRLTAAGLLRREEEDGGRNRKTYHLTEEGRRAISHWAATPLGELPETRDTALLQLFFSDFTTAESIIAIARSQIALHQERLALYEELSARHAGNKALARRMAPIGFGLRFERAQIAFWTEIAENPPGEDD